MTATTRWGTRAAGLYDRDYARQYREHDEAIRPGSAVGSIGVWLGRVCESFGKRIDVLDLGCGTGRYFHVLRRVRKLVGVDVSEPMLAEARRPVDASALAVQSITLVHADFLSPGFTLGTFDLIYSIGVLAEHSPFDEAIAARVHGWLRAGGRFAFTAVHPRSFCVRRTAGRRLGEAILPFAIGPVRTALRARLMSGGLYADEEQLRTVLARSGFTVESVEPLRSDIHLHSLVVARHAS